MEVSIYAIQRYCYCLFLIVADMLTTSPGTGNHVDSPKGQTTGLNCHPGLFMYGSPAPAYTFRYYMYQSPTSNNTSACVKRGRERNGNGLIPISALPPIKIPESPKGLARTAVIRTSHSHTARPLRGSAATPAPSICRNGASVHGRCCRFFGSHPGNWVWPGCHGPLHARHSD